MAIIRRKGLYKKIITSSDFSIMVDFSKNQGTNNNNYSLRILTKDADTCLFFDKNSQNINNLIQMFEELSKEIKKIHET